MVAKEEVRSGRRGGRGGSAAQEGLVLAEARV